MEWLQLRLSGGGTLRFREDGSLVHFAVFCGDGGRGAHKIYVYGAGGSMLLGTLCPGQSGAKLTCRISKSRLERCGCWPIVWAQSVQSGSFERESFWKQELHPEQMVSDSVLREALANRSMLLKRGEDGFDLAADFDPKRPFPLTPLFCLARIRAVEGRTCVVFRFDGEGNPIVPHNGCNGGENSGIS